MKRGKLIGLGVGLVLALSTIFPSPLLATTSALEPLRINEIHPKVVSGAADDTAYEYVELYNPNDTDVSLGEYSIDYYSANAITPKSLILDATTVISGRGYTTVRSSLTLADNGARLQLLLQNQVIQQVSYQTVSSGALSWSNYNDGWRLTDTTPGRANPSLSQPPQYENSRIDITEIVTNESENQPLFIELYNPAIKSVNIKDYTLRTVSPTKTADFIFGGSMVIEPDKYVAIAVKGNDIALTSEAGGYIELYAADGSLVSRSEPYPRVKAGYSWINDGSEWQVSTIPTPNAANKVNAPVSLPLFITEMLPNPDGSDAGNEFVEIYNPNNEVVSLSGYKLLIGSRPYALPDNVEIHPGEFMVFHDNELGFSLTNIGLSISLFAPSGDQVFGPVSYVDAVSGESWALINNTWQFTDSITKTRQNIAHSFVNEDRVISSASLIPCEPGKYRNPLTNRCRTIETDVVALAACNDGEYRNPDTNRCRKIVLASTELTPCKEGQVRNSETNRCRSVTSEVAALLPCDEGYERNPSTNRCRKVLGASATTGDAKTNGPIMQKGQISNGYWIAAAALLGATGYGIYEWRSEITNGARKLSSRFGRKT